MQFPRFHNVRPVSYRNTDGGDMDRKDILEKIGKRQQELFETLGALIRINSENFGSTGNEREIAEYLGREFEKLGLPCEVYSPLSVPGIEKHVDYYPGRNLENRYNCSVTVPGTNHEKCLHLAAHLDTEIIGDLSGWTVPPLGGIVKDGKIWGRGAGDDKSGIAAVLFLIRFMKEEGIRLPYDLVFTAYCDEEKGGGNGALAACLKYPSDDCLNLDGDDLDIWSGGAGGGCLSAGFATKEPVDSCEVLTDAVAVYREEMDAFRKRRHDELAAIPLFAKSTIPDAAVRFQTILIGGELSLNRARATLCFYTSRTEEEIREELREITGRLKERLDPLGIVFEGIELTTRFFRFAMAKEENPAAELLQSSIQEITGLKKETMGSCLSDYPLFLNYGSPRALTFGPGRDFGAYGGAHQPDEHIECDTFLKFTQILADFMLKYC